MTPRVPLIAAVTVVLSALFVADALSPLRAVPSPAEAELRERVGRTFDAVAAAQRVYHQRFKDTGLPLTTQTLVFVPNHAVDGLARAVIESDGAASAFATVTDRPEGSGEPLEASDREALEFFRSHPAETAFFRRFESGDSAYFLYARPVRLETNCFVCHGPDAKAPPYLLADRNPGRKLGPGDLRAIHRMRIVAEGPGESDLERRFLDAAPLYAVALLAAIGAILLIVRRPAPRDDGEAA